MLTTERHRLLLLLMVIVVSVSMNAQSLSYTMVELNCENLFDCEHDSLKQDEDFLPSGIMRWSHARYWKKVNNIAREILSCGESEGGYAIPDLVALCEVENDTVLRDLTQRSLLRNAKYEYIVTHSPDLRGIDVALLYSPFSFGYIDSRPIRVEPLKDMRPTRDILYVKGRTSTDDTLHVFVIHAPSRYGGEYETRANRVHVVSRLAESVDSVRTLSPRAKIIIAGDFNDYSTDKSIKILTSNGFVHVSDDAKGANGAEGTYKYQGKWGSIDHVFLSRSLLPNFRECFIADREFLLCKDEDYGGIQPRRNLKGVKWQNGFSDHLPLVVRFYF